MATKKKPERDVNKNVKRIFDEMIERSEQPPQRGNLSPVKDKPETKKAR